MGDPICRWRNATVKQICEFNQILPKEDISSELAHKSITERWAQWDGGTNNFFKTPYQLALQLGLYYEKDSMMIVRYHHVITFDEARHYIKEWFKRYYVPNPYTKSLSINDIEGGKPVVINRYLVNWVIDNNGGLWEDAKQSLFHTNIGNDDIILNLINNYSEVEIGTDGRLRIKQNLSANKYSESETHLDVSPFDKEEFFHWFDVIIGKEDISKTLPAYYSALPLQVIYYGAPGTGKSHAIKDLTEGKRVIRTTFHPDSDYSTFVGAYKPTTVDDPVMTVIGTKAVPVENPDGTDRTEKKIVYEFVPQAFLQAYVNAWLAYANAKDGEGAKEQYLVIEEINRGNCAQIFGDLFQLLDRNDDGYSEYPINADKDMEKYLSEAFEKIAIPGEDKLSDMFKDPGIAQKIGSGKVLVLPPNLHIWATMNTSDQSLFPIDSAFKRRWDWKYIPISEGIDKQTHMPLGWKLKVNDMLYDWWAFLQAIDVRIGDLTKSQDKKLGYFFCKAKDGVIDAETLVGKVLFFLWNEVLKDFQEDQPFLSDGNGGNLKFDDFYAVDAKGKTVVQEDKVERLLANLGLKPLPTEGDSEPTDEGQGGNGNEEQQTDETEA